MVRGVSNRMESTMYEDNNFNHRINNDVNRLKRNLTLDLDCNNLNAKRPKYNSPMMLGVPVLSSPDVSKLKLTSPEIEKFILAQQNGLLFTPTPSTPHSKILFPKSITDQEPCDLPDDLTEFTTTDSSQGSLQVEMPRSSSGSNSSSGNLLLDNSFGSMHTEYSSINHLGGIKDEHQIVPSLDSTPPLSPINMESQEIIKLERKRMRNRVAASKCRRRKLERIAKLEDRVKVLKGENSELNSIIIKLKEEVCKLKQNVLEHVQGGCQIIVSNFCAKNHDG